MVHRNKGHLLFTVTLLHIITYCTHLFEVTGNYISLGCFTDNLKDRDLPYKAKYAVSTVDACVDACLRQYFRYAGLQETSMCFCGGDYGRHGAGGGCDQQCKGNTSQVCGGVLANNIYDTGQLVPGPPSALELLNATDTSVQVRWEKPLATNGVIDSYRILAQLEHTEPRMGLHYYWDGGDPPKGMPINGLHPASQYNVSVTARTSLGFGVPKWALFWTQIGEPDEPEVPTVIKRDRGQLEVKLTAVQNSSGPITAYRIVVIFGDGLSASQPECLKSWQEAREEEISCYIAAEILPKDFKSVFVVGDGRMYGKYFNPPLPLDAHVHVSLGVVSSLNGVTKERYAQTGHGIVVLNVGDDDMSSELGTSGLVIGLSVAIGVFGFLLLLSVIIYCVLRQRMGGRRRIPDHQELSLQGPIIEVEANGFLHNGYIPDDEEEHADHYTNLKQQVWSIPHNFLDIRPEVLGRGRYGPVNKGNVQQRGFFVPVAIHTIADRDLSAAEKKNMLRDLDVLIKIGVRENLVHLVGICENTDTLYVVLEYHPTTLKEQLLSSRCYDSAASDGHRFCSFSERHVLEAALGVSRAMDHLLSNKILHKQLAARNVIMADGIVAKVSDIGMAHYQKDNEIPDYTRWTAQEIFRGRSHVSKSDVWSFGCLLWEMTALGGTPYAEVQTGDIPGRVMRGARLPRLHYVGDDLYQLMLQCWQLDLDERPTFQEITHILTNLVEESEIHINFGVYAGFHYEQYILAMELQS